VSGATVEKIADPRALAWGGTLAVGAAGWLALAATHGPARMDWATFLALCAAGAAPPTAAMLPVAALMWLLMAFAMMAPTAAPAAETYARLIARDGPAGGRLAAFLAGYLAVWGVFGVGGAALQTALAVRGVAEGGLVLSGALLAVAGAWQLSALKARCLALCRNPMTFFLAHWREGAGGAFAMGVRHGLVCVGCCWALMLLMLAFGAMNLLWMAALGAVMMAEKVAPRAVPVGRALGAAAVVAGGALLLAGLA
jgi:predicted metal-binding membrane protein